MTAASIAFTYAMTSDRSMVGFAACSVAIVALSEVTSADTAVVRVVTSA